MNQNVREMTREVSEEEVEEMIKTLPKTQFPGTNQLQLIKYQGFWFYSNFLRSTMNCQRNFIAKDTDVFITSFPKSGTTWLKSLMFSVVNRHTTPITQSPLLRHNPHELVIGLEFTHSKHIPQLLSADSAPRLLSSHLPYTSLPETIRSSKAKVVYITRNPLDLLVSFYHFNLSFIKNLVNDFTPPKFEQFVDDFCEGKLVFGPFFDHVLKSWNASLGQPEKVLFLKYEDLKTNPKLHLKKLAEFIGVPFSTQEENNGVIDDIIELCSFKNMKELEVNKSGYYEFGIEWKVFFRKGEVGDWTNHFTPPMVEKMNQFMQQHLKGTSLSFDVSTTI